MKTDSTDPEQMAVDADARTTGSRRLLITALAVIMVALHIFAVFKPIQAMSLRTAHLALALPLIFLFFPTPSTRLGWPLARAIDLMLALAGAAASFYVFWEANDLVMHRMGMANTYDLVAGAVLVVIVLEATRRVIGLGLPFIAVLFLAYLVWGHLLDGMFWHRPFGLEQIVTGLSLHTEGIFGIPLGVAATYVFLFMVLGAVLQLNGAGGFFIDLATAAFGTMRGGPAKVAIVASGFFGSINGSSVANVASTGAYTIPMMKRSGYPAARAGAIEAAASSGGQIMPPIMGAAGFIVAEFLGISYWTVALGALIPGLLYFAALLMMAHLEATRQGLQGLPRSELASPRAVLRAGWLHFLPLLVLLISLGAMGHSPQRAAFFAIVTAIAVSFFHAEGRMTPARLLSAMRIGVRSALIVAAATASAGIVIGVVTITGAGLKLSSLLIDMSGGVLILLLLLTMVTSLILGMGLPTTAAYIILAVLVAPTLTQLGVDPLAAHLFILYFGAFSAITPPVGIAAYAGAAIANSGPNRTAALATLFGFAAYLLPFMMIYSPAYVLNDTPLAIALAAARGILAVIMFPAVLQGYLLERTTVPERCALLLGAVLIVYPQWQFDLASIALFGGVLASQLRRRKGAGQGNAARAVGQAKR